MRTTYLALGTRGSGCGGRSGGSGFAIAIAVCATGGGLLLANLGLLLVDHHLAGFDGATFGEGEFAPGDGAGFLDDLEEEAELGNAIVSRLMG
jgi:hypothetical protein